MEFLRLLVKGDCVAALLGEDLLPDSHLFDVHDLDHTGLRVSAVEQPPLHVQPSYIRARAERTLSRLALPVT